ncbi:MAG: S9 family peptidase, partial [bacterium]
KNPLTVKDIYDSNKFRGTTIANVHWIPDGSAFTFTKSDGNAGPTIIYKHQVKSGKTSVVISEENVLYNGKPIGISGYAWSADGKSLLLRGKLRKVWRHSRQAPFFLYDINSKQLTAIDKANATLKNAKLSPDGSLIGFVRKHNIYISDTKTGTERALTNDGTENILNGEFDWVYEEEFGLADGWRWSPDGKKIAFWQVDQTRVKSFAYNVDQTSLYNVVKTVRYPKAGEQNAIVKIGVADIESGKIVWMDLGEETDIYVPRIFWTNTAKKLAILRLNRLQNHLDVLLADTENGNTRPIVTDTNPAWIDVRHEMLFLHNKDQFIMTSEKPGFKHAYLYDYQGKLIQQLTNGNWEISSLVGVDERKGLLYFYGKKDSPLENNVYRVGLNGKNLKRISRRAGWHTGNFSPDFKHVVGFFSDINTPTQVMLRKADGSLVRFLEKNELAAISEYQLPKPEFLTFTTDDNVDLNAYMIKPANFDENKKYPVLVYGYGCPGSQMVVNRWGGDRMLWHQLMTEKGYIIFCVDNRGTGGRGKAFKNLSYRDISKLAVHDQIEGAKYLGRLSYVDKSRIGFWGWSGGGYLTLMMMMRGADYFKTGIAVAPVSDFGLYDTIWTERYMGLPQENKEGYAAANVLNYVDGLKGNLLIIHGTGDDNVHIQNTMQVAKAVQDRAIQFDMMIYPNRNHGISGGKTRLHLFTKMTNYLLEKL